MVLWWVLSFFYIITLDHRILDDKILGDRTEKEAKFWQWWQRHETQLFFSSPNVENSTTKWCPLLCSFFLVFLGDKHKGKHFNLVPWQRNKEPLSGPHSLYCILKSYTWVTQVLAESQLNVWALLAEVQQKTMKTRPCQEFYFHTKYDFAMFTNNKENLPFRYVLTMSI